VIFLRHLLAILLLPVMATMVIPALLLSGLKDPTQFFWPPLRPLPLGLGIILIGLGLTLLVATNLLFIRVGQGTLAPWDPTQKMVARGVYRHVRNPMISGVSFILLGEAMASGFLPLFNWFFIFVVANLIYIPWLEEPGLERRFGEAYRVYKQHVPRWIPRLWPWQG
jgi:protein-S-isoprenylcysteine O-methyltransferase Ste14